MTLVNKSNQVICVVNHVYFGTVVKVKLPVTILELEEDEIAGEAVCTKIYLRLADKTTSFYCPVLNDFDILPKQRKLPPDAILQTVVDKLDKPGKLLLVMRNSRECYKALQVLFPSVGYLKSLQFEVRFHILSGNLRHATITHVFQSLISSVGLKYGLL
jgi:hypothetical protein